MTAWKIWPLPQSGTPRARVTAPLWPKTERSWVELSTLRLMGERTQHCRPWFFPAARFTPAVPTIGQMSESARRQSPPTCRLTGHFAVSEHHMDRIAQAVGLSPIEVRRRNFLRPGQTTTTDQEVREPIDLGKLLDRALEL